MSRPFGRSDSIPNNNTSNNKATFKTTDMVMPYVRIRTPLAHAHMPIRRVTLRKVEDTSIGHAKIPLIPVPS